MCACVRTFVTCWEVLRAASAQWPNPCCSTAFVQFFCLLFVNLLCRKPEIESQGFTCNWLVLVGRLAWTSATCTYFRVADKFTTAKRKAGTLYHAKSFRDTQHSFGCCVLPKWRKHQRWSAQNSSDSDQTYDDAQVSQPHTYMHILPCLSRWQVPCTSKTSSFHSSAAGTPEFWNPCTQQHQRRPAEAKPRNICSACLSRWHLPRRSPPFIWLSPQPTQKCWQQWPTVELTPSRKRLLPPGMVKANDDEACIRLAHAQVENEIPARPRRAPRRGAREYRRLRAFPMGNPHSNEIDLHLRFGGGGGGGGVASSPPPKRSNQIKICFPSSAWKKKAFDVHFCVYGGSYRGSCVRAELGAPLFRNAVWQGLIFHLY